MILAKGKIYDSTMQESILEGMEEEITQTILRKPLSAARVVEAVGRLGDMFLEGQFQDIISAMDIEMTPEYYDSVAMLLSRENLIYKLHTQLGGELAQKLLLGEEQFFDTGDEEKEMDGLHTISARTHPLGTLFHIAAGNVDGLPAFSVVEGLLTGNVNILKLPQADGGLSVTILSKLIEIEPAAADYIYVFDTPSSDHQAMKKMAALSDAVVVWGGDEAVAAVRKFAPCGVRLVEWGHKLSFAYVSGYEKKQEELKALAEHIVSTRQLFCSSCQVIFMDTDRMEEIHEFCLEFLPYLEQAAEKYPLRSVGAAAEITLRRYNDKLLRMIGGEDGTGSRIYQGMYTSVTAMENHGLELSDMFGNCLVKRLKVNNLPSCLRIYKGKLQTAGLICEPNKREKLVKMLTRCGLVRITRAGNMSAVFAGEAHDGEYPLQRYLKTVNVEP